MIESDRRGSPLVCVGRWSMPTSRRFFAPSRFAFFFSSAGFAEPSSDSCPTEEVAAATVAFSPIAPPPPPTSSSEPKTTVQKAQRGVRRRRLLVLRKGSPLIGAVVPPQDNLGRSFHP